MTTKRRAKPGEALAALKSAINSQTDECILWEFATIRAPGDRKLYGVVSIDGRTHKASRLVCECVHGKPPTPKHHAAHAAGIECNSLCINPRHLRWATPSENGMDRHLDGTMTERPRKLSKQEVREIFFAEGVQREIAERFAVCQQEVSYIKSGKHLYSRDLLKPSDK